jgi:hypothetical protein
MREEQTQLLQSGQIQCASAAKFMRICTLDRKGKPVRRQADVYAEFLDGAGERKRLVVQAKHYKHAISLPVVDSLSGMLASLEQPCQGMLITPSRYQSGAAPVATSLDLQACILTRTKPEHFIDEKIPGVNISLKFHMFTADNFQVQLEPNLPDDVVEKFSADNNNNRELYDENGVLIGTMSMLTNDIEKMLIESGQTEFYRTFVIEPNPFVKILGHDGFVRITGIRGKFKRELRHVERIQKQASYLFHRLNDNETLLFDNNLEVFPLNTKDQISSPWIDMRGIFPEWFNKKGELLVTTSAVAAEQANEQ